MPHPTPLDRAHAAMQAAPGDDAARLKFYERLADGELFMLLAAEAEGDRITPREFALEGGRFVLVFDREDRLSDFTGEAAPYAALSGRRIAAMLAGQGIGLGVNLGVAPSSILIPAGAVDWLAATLAARPERIEARPVALSPPVGVPETLLAAIDTKLATATGLAPLAYLAGVTYEEGQQGHMLAFVDALEGARDALASAVAEALSFSGIEAGALDVAFFAASDPITARLARTGLQIDLPQPPRPTPAPVTAPGSDPDNPPKLR